MCTHLLLRPDLFVRVLFQLLACLLLFLLPLRFPPFSFLLVLPLLLFYHPTANSTYPSSHWMNERHVCDSPACSVKSIAKAGKQRKKDVLYVN